MPQFPEQYRKVLNIFFVEYFNRRKWQIENNYLVMLPTEAVASAYKTPEMTPFGHQLIEIAQAAAGLLPDDEMTRGTVYEGIQDLMEQLFSPPGLDYGYRVPNEFWDTPLGSIVGKAYVWAAQDDLITQTEAGKLLGRSVNSINNYIRAGKLTGYRDPDTAPHKPGGRLVSRREIEGLAQK